MKLLLPLFLCTFFAISTHCSDAMIMYFGFHNEPQSTLIASGLNLNSAGIALNIPVLYLQNLSMAIMALVVAVSVYRFSKALISLDHPLDDCMCDMCLDDLMNDID